MKNLTLNKKLAAIAIALGFIGVFLGNPYKGNVVSMDTKELGIIVQKEVDHVSVENLADWIIQSKADFKLIDLRTEKEYNEYHIPNSENITLTGLEKSDIPKTEKIVIYSEGGIHSAQAWMLLKARGYKGVYMLMGGLEDWKDKILFPKLPENAAPEQIAKFEKTKEVSKFFGGTPSVGGTADSKTETPKMEMPKLENPSGNQPPGGAPKKKKEGC
jgi:hypothetical protein